MTLRVYGAPLSRTERTYWMCRELGLDFEAVEVSFYSGEIHGREYHAVNPNERIPSIDDDGFVLWESMAINLYLARKHGGELCPQGLQEEARAWQWSFWVMTEIEKPLLYVTLARLRFPEGSAAERYFGPRREALVAQEADNEETLQKPLGVLDEHLAERDWLIAERFTVADLNVASVMAWSQPARLDLSTYPRARDWLGRCLSRPAFSS